MTTSPTNERKRTQIMTLKEVARYLGLHEITVYRYVKHKQLPGFKIGGQWRFKKEILDNFLDRQIAHETEN